MTKSLANCRTRNQNPNHSVTKGDRDLDIICELYGYVNLNKKYDNYTTPIDCIDEKIDLFYQVKGSCCKARKYYFSSLEREWKKQYKAMILVCKSNDGKKIEEIYIIPVEEIKERKLKTLHICKNRLKNSKILYWYEKYRIDGAKREEDIRRANEILQRKLDEENRNKKI